MTVYDSDLKAQRIFRELMNAFAHPFRVHSIKSEVETGPSIHGENSVITELCQVFLDNSVSFCVCGDENLAAGIREMTYAKPAEIDKADFIVIKNPGKFESWDKIYPGTLFSPHKGATVVVDVPSIAGDVKIMAEGPGINGRISYFVDSGIAECLFRAAELDIEYPMGFELIFVTGQGDIIAVPRHVKVYGEVLV